MLLAVLAQTLTIFTAEPQLNTSAFAGCLARRGAQIDQIPIWPDLTAIRREHGLSHRDGLLLYLALYANRRTSCLNATEMDAFERWAMPFWPNGAIVANWMRDSVRNKTQTSRLLTPGEMFGKASEACERGQGLSRNASSLCAALTMHNVLRTLGRTTTYIGSDGADYLPPWFKADALGWLEVAAQLPARMISLRRDGNGDGWGEWYHAAGVLTFGLHEFALEGPRLAAAVTYIVATLNAVLNPVLAGGNEDPNKARLDRDSAEVATSYAQGLARHSVDGSYADADWRAACSSSQGYVL